MRKLALFLSMVLFIGLQTMTAQTKDITGKVVDDLGEAVPGVSIVVKGTTIGTISRPDGTYSLSVPEDATNLVFTFVGMETQDVLIAGQSTINVTMQSDTEDLDEVIVTALGVSREKKAIGYAATSIGGDDIAKSQVVNPMNAIQGKVAGVEVSTGAGPGATQNVIIRGTSSFGNVQPLYIVDGVPITNEQSRGGDNLNSQVDFGSGINALNPDDIEDMTILKGAAATALYGSRAANGVIMITTKSGKDTGGKVKVNYSGSYTISRVGRLPEVQDQFGQGWSGDRALDENGNWGPAYDGKDRVWGNIVDYSQQVKPYVFLENRVRDFFDYGENFKNSLSLSGGNENTQYFLSLSQNSQDGVYPTDNDSYDRYTISTRGSHKAGDLTVSTSVNFSTENQSAIPSGQGTSVFRSLYEIAEDISVVDLEDLNNPFNNLDNYFTPYGVNPYYVLNNDGANSVRNKIFGKFQLDYDLFESLKLTYRFGADLEMTDSEKHTAIIAFTPGAPNHGSSAATTGAYEHVKRTRTQLNQDIMASFTKSLTKDLNVNVIAGVNINERKYDWLQGEITNVDIPGTYKLWNSNSPSISDQYFEKRRLVGLYGNVDLSYKNYLYLTLTARNDWSSTLPIDNNSFFYPGATVSFLVKDFMENQGISTGPVSFAKLRLAYGQTGNDTDPYFVYDRYVSAFSSNPGYPDIDDLEFPLGGVNSYMASNRLGNPDLKPEITTEFEIGAEMRFLKNRIGFDFSYYDRFTDGLIASLPKDPSSGYTTQRANLGDVRNKGIELVVDGYPFKGDFTWHVSWNFATNENKVEKLDVGEVYLSGFGTGGIYAVEGEAMGQFKFPMAKKVDIDGDKYTVVDGSGMPQPTPDQEWLGKDVNEDFRMGLVNTFSYKGITLSGTLDWRSGGHMFSYTKDYMHWTGSSPESVLNDRKTFIVPNSVVDNGDGTYSENTVPVDPTALHTFYSRGGFDAEDYSIIDRSYLKLRNLSLSYNLPKSVSNKVKMSNIAVSFNASNILLWTPAENPYIDPETTTFGNNIDAKFGEFGSSPTNEFYTFGLTFSL
ncbi:SusC/RagA family TonB-linked outer membrane protein [Labilibacter sediminis]|nr:SusC/RagA family TonB-linked outer membrane protein [Labilibacter sediminis]